MSTDVEPVSEAEVAEDATSPYDEVRLYVAGLVGHGEPDMNPADVARLAIITDDAVRELLDTLLADRDAAWAERLSADQEVSREHLEHAWEDGKMAARGGGKPRNPYKRRNGD